MILIFFLDYFGFAVFSYYMDDGIFVYTHSNFWSHLVFFFSSSVYFTIILCFYYFLFFNSNC
jgi:hypothetical protein